MKKNFRELILFTQISLKELRVTGVFTTLLSLVIPLGIAVLVSVISGMADEELGMQILSGNIVLILSQTCIVFLGTRCGELNQFGGFEHYSSFPVKSVSIVGGMILQRLILIIPFVIILYVVSSMLFPLKWVFNPWLFAALGMTIISFASLGMLIGLAFDHHQKTSMATNIVMFFVMFGTPLYYSIQSLPLPIQFLQFCLPFYSSVHAVQETLTQKNISSLFFLDLLVLGITTIVFSYLINRRIPKLLRYGIIVFMTAVLILLAILRLKT